MRIQDRVLGITFSEFGRRIKSNGSMGTDHGAAYPSFVFGTRLFGGMLGVTLFGIFLTPVFYYVIQWFAERNAPPSAAAEASPARPPPMVSRRALIPTSSPMAWRRSPIWRRSC